jgi:hypothetical protein
MKERYCHIC